MNQCVTQSNGDSKGNHIQCQEDGKEYCQRDNSKAQSGHLTSMDTTSTMAALCQFPYSCVYVA